jgi:hypothetical protein
MADRYNLYTMRTSVVNGEEKSFSTSIGVMFKSKDKDSFVLRLSALPIANKEGEVVVFAAPPKDKNDQPSGRSYQQSSSSNSDQLDDSIPF